jgi:hypothetical protein
VKWATFFTARHSDTDPERQYDIRSEKWNPLGGAQPTGVLLSCSRAEPAKRSPLHLRNCPKSGDF